MVAVLPTPVSPTSKTGSSNWTHRPTHSSKVRDDRV